MTSIFISYSRKDSRFVRTLVEDLAMNDIPVWMDQREIDFGDLWEQKIHRALEVCDSMLLVLSPDAVDSDNVRDELNLCIKREKRLIPLLYRECDLPTEIKPVNFADFRGDYQPALETLILRLQKAAIESQAVDAKLPLRNPLAWKGTVTFGRVILSEARKAAPMARNIEDLWQGIDRASDTAVQAINDCAFPINTLEMMEAVAITACGDVEIGSLAAEAMSRTGRDGLIQVLENDTINYNELEIIEGIHLDYGWASPKFLTDPIFQKAVLDNPYILICDESISEYDLEPVITKLERSSHEALVVIAQKITNTAISALLRAKASNKLCTLAVSLESAGARASVLLEDVAIRTGAKLVSPDTGLTCDKLTLRGLGRAAQITCDQQSLTITDGAGRSKDINARINSIRAELDNMRSEADQEFLRIRMAMLSSCQSLITIGGLTEEERTETKLRLKAALRAVLDSIEGGGVAGAGVASMSVQGALIKLKPKNEDERRGIDAVSVALEAPIREIVIRTEEDSASVIDRITAERERLNTTNIGYDPQTMKYVNVLEAGIIDPAKRVKTALQRGHELARLIFFQ